MACSSACKTTAYRTLIMFIQLIQTKWSETCTPTCSVNAFDSGAAIAVFTESVEQCLLRISFAASQGRAIVMMPDCQETTVSSMRRLGCAIWTEQHYLEEYESDHDFECVDGIYFATSGSTGAAKFIFKSYDQLLSETQFFVNYLGNKVSNVGGTASHQHIYGFLFRLMFPLVAGCSAADRRWRYPEEFNTALARADGWLIVSTPAHLSRLGLVAPVSGRVVRVLSSGGRCH